MKKFPQQKAINQLLAELKRAKPDIRAHEEDDWTWADEGMDMIGNEDYLMAELKFQELILAQPEHFDGYEGLALTYQALGKQTEAVLLIDYAVHLCEDFVETDRADRAVLDELRGEQEAIHGM
jgi:tetratricopeptide (TPR) repeat protein